MGYSLSRVDLAWTIFRMALIIVALVTLYYLLPSDSKIGALVLIRFLVGFSFFVALLVWQIRHILSSSRPGLRAVESMATIAVLFIVLFAVLYYSMGRSDAAGFSQHLDKTTALYFTVTILSTVGFGDITPITDPARVAVMLQMVMDIILIAVVLRLIMSAAKIGHNRQSNTAADQPAQETEDPAT